MSSCRVTDASGQMAVALVRFGTFCCDRLSLLGAIFRHQGRTQFDGESVPGGCMTMCASNKMQPLDDKPVWQTLCLPAVRAGIIHRGFSLVELLISITIISVLLGLLLPAVQIARESARQTQCQNNLRQVGQALLLYHDVQQTFPHGGWGHEWVGVPEQGFGESQPGGWIYSTLPYLEQGALQALGSGQTGSAADSAYSQRLKTPLPVFVCPTRRPCSTWRVAEQYSYVRSPKPHGDVAEVARGDYAINGGADHISSFPGPPNLTQGDSDVYWASTPSLKNFSGISHLRRAASLRSVEDGASKTYLVGEKHVPVNKYETGTSLGDNESLYSGYCTDLHRFVGATERENFGLSPHAPPLDDRDSSEPGSIDAFLRFGSAHSSGFFMVNCDGSSRLVAYDIDPAAHYRAGHRRDQGKSFKYD